MIPFTDRGKCWCGHKAKEHLTGKRSKCKCDYYEVPLKERLKTLGKEKPLRRG